MDGSQVLRRALGRSGGRATRTRTAQTLALGALLLTPFAGLAGTAWWIAQGESRPHVVEIIPAPEFSIPPLASRTLDGVGASTRQLVPSHPRPLAPLAVRRRGNPRPPTRAATPTVVGTPAAQRAAPVASARSTASAPAPPSPRFSGSWAPAPPSWPTEVFLQLRGASERPNATPGAPGAPPISDPGGADVIRPSPKVVTVRGFDAEPLQRRILAFLLGKDTTNIRLAGAGPGPEPTLTPVLQPEPIDLPEPGLSLPRLLEPILALEPVQPEPALEPVLPEPVLGQPLPDPDPVTVAGPLDLPWRLGRQIPVYTRTLPPISSGLGTGASQVPEPSSGLLLGAGLVGLAARRRARR